MYEFRIDIKGNDGNKYKDVLLLYLEGYCFYSSILRRLLLLCSFFKGQSNAIVAKVSYLEEKAWKK